MAVSRKDFLRRLKQSGLLELDDDLAAAVVDCSANAELDGAGIARELVKRKKLSRFQAAAVYQNKTRHLMLGNYVLLERIGAGGMGQVFKARHQRLNRIVALKLIPADKIKSEVTRQRFQRETRAAAQLDHPNIVRTLDADTEDEISFLVMEYVDGQDLDTVLSKRGRLDPETAINYTIQAARGLQYAHSKNIIHRDIKPANLLLNKAGEVKLLDMGLARFENADGDSHLTKAGEIMGTIDYLPPEQIDDKADSRADIYSLGCTLFRLVTGAKPYKGATVMKKLLAHRDAPVPLITDHRDDVPSMLTRICKRMMAKNPADRFQSMNELIVALEKIGCGDSSVIDLDHEAPDDLQSFLQSMSVELNSAERPGSSGDVAMESLAAAKLTTAAPGLDHVRRSRRVNWWFVLAGLSCIVLLVTAVVVLATFARPNRDADGVETPLPTASQPTDPVGS